MKKIVYLFAFLFSIHAQAQDYTFSMRTEAYTYLSSPTIVDNKAWDEFEYPVKMPFNFLYYGVKLGDSIYLDSYATLSVDNTYNGEISFLSEDLMSRGLRKSPVSYKVEGTSPNRIMKFEFRNTGFYNDSATLADSAHVQCWLYENDYSIEFHYGPNKVRASSWSDNGAFVGIYNEVPEKFIILQKSPAAPTVNRTDLSNSTTLNGMPANGTVYKFTPINAGIKTMTKGQIKIIDHKICVEGVVKISDVSVYNLNGQKVLSNSSIEEMDLSNLIRGVYTIVITTDQGVISEKKML